MSTETALQTLPESPDYETQLQECLTNIHESSRVASEINTLQIKLNSLSSIKKTLVTGDNLANTTLDQLNRTIGEVQASIDAKKSEMKQSETVTIEGFLKVMSNIAKKAETKSDNIFASMKDSLTRFGSILRKENEEGLAVFKTKLEQLEKGKMDRTEKEAVLDKLNVLKGEMGSTKADISNDVMIKVHEALKVVYKQVANMAETVNPENISTKVHSKVMEEIDFKLKQQLELVQNAQKESKTTTDNLHSTIDQLVKKQLDQQITPTQIQKIIQSLPEYELMQKAGKQLAETSTALATPTATAPPVDVANHPSLLAIKQSVLALSNQLTELKQSNESTRTIVDTLRQQNVLPSSLPTEVDTQAAVKHMEKMEKEVTLMFNNIKMIETVVNLKSKEMGDLNNSSTDLTISRKRPRTEEGTDVVPFDKDMQDYLVRLNDIETKHQKLLDFIVQCKDTILDDQFPVKIEAAMAKIEQVLLNHEKFIAFLVDPFSTARNVSIPTTPETLSKDMLSPSMVDAISQLVKKTAEEISLPLQKKIKLLEDKLEARSSS